MLRALARGFAKLLLAVLALLVLAVGAIGILTVSEPGSRWVINQALTWVPGEIQVGAIRGRLVTGLEIDAIDYREAQTSVQADRLVLRWQPADLLRGTVRVRQLLLDNLAVTSTGESVESTAFTPPERIPLPITVVLEDVRLQNLQVDTGSGPTHIDSLALSARAGPLQGLVIRDFSVNLQGSGAHLSGRAELQQPYAFKASLDWHGALPDNVQANGHARLRGDLAHVEIEHSLSRPFEISTVGQVQFGNGTPHMDLHGRWRQIQWPLAGAADYSSSEGDYSLAGTFSNYRLALNGALAGSDIPAAQVHAAGEGDAQGIRVNALTLDTLNGSAEATGKLAWAPHFSLGLAITGRQLDPGLAYPTGHGRLDVNTQLEVDVGEQRSLVALRDLKVNGTLQEHALAASGTLLFDDGIPSTPGLVVESGASRAHVSGSLDSRGANFDVSVPQLETLLPGASGKLQAQGRVTGPFDRLAGRATLSGDALAYADNRTATLQADVQFDAGRQQRAKLRLQAQDATLAGQPVDRLSLAADGSLAQHDATLELDAPQGEARLHVAGAYRDNGWHGQMDTASLTLAEIGAWHLREPVPLAVDGQNVEPFRACWVSEQRELCLQGVLRDQTARMRLAASAAQGHARGELAITGLGEQQPRLDGQVDMDIPDLKFLNALMPGERIAAGHVNARARLAGTVDAPQITGSAALSGGELRVAELGLDITAIELQARAHGQQITLDGSAHSVKGDVTLDGDATLDPAQHWPFRMALKGKDFAIAHLPDIEINANPDLNIQGSAQQADVSGRILIPYAEIKVKKLPPGVVRVSEDQVIVGPTAPKVVHPAPGYPVSLNVVAVLGDHVHFDGLGLTTDLTGSLNVRSLQSKTLIGNGVLELRKGKYEGYGQKLDIEQGRLLFAGPLNNPGLDVRATRTVGSVVAGIEVYGNADRPQTRLFSTPAMTDAQILSYLVTGKPLDQASGSTDSRALAAAAASLGANSPVAQQLSQKLGVEIGVESGTSDSDTSLVVSKQLSSRLSIDYVYGLFNESAAIQFIYELTDHLSLTGRSGNVQSIDLNYSIERP